MKLLQPNEVPTKGTRRGIDGDALREAGARICLYIEIGSHQLSWDLSIADVDREPLHGPLPAEGLRELADRIAEEIVRDEMSAQIEIRVKA